jgi:hypothetical protein
VPFFDLVLVDREHVDEEVIGVGILTGLDRPVHELAEFVW